jgi:hypothetical protein
MVRLYALYIYRRTEPHKTPIAVHVVRRGLITIPNHIQVNDSKGLALSWFDVG